MITLNVQECNRCGHIVVLQDNIDLLEYREHLERCLSAGMLTAELKAITKL